MKYFWLMILFPVVIFGQAIEVFNANSVADIIEKKSSSYKSFKATFVYQKDNRSYSGEMIYVAPNKFMMQFKQNNAPLNRVIVSDGEYIYVREGDIIARQRIKEETSVVKAWNLRRMRKQYIATAPKNGMEVTYNEKPAYHIIFEPKWNTTSFRNIEIIANTDGLIRRIRGTSRIGTITTLSLGYQEFNQEYDPKIFRIETTEESQIYDNIFE